MATVLYAGAKHMLIPNSPPESEHRLLRKGLSSLHRARRVAEKLWQPSAAITPVPSLRQDYDVVHSMNAIPLTSRPWVVTFESMLPRSIGPGARAVAASVRPRLLKPNCHSLLAMSEYARRVFIRQNEDWSELDRVLPKLSVLRSAVPLQSSSAKELQPDRPLRLVFVGNDFARKGGIVALRAVREANRRGIPVTLDVVSNMNVAGSVYTDAPQRSHYVDDLKLLDSPNVTFHGRVPHRRVMQLLAECDIQVMPTLDDTFGWSILEGFSHATPTITTNVCALPEFVHSGANGYQVELERNEVGQWVGRGQRATDKYWSLLDSTFEALAEQVVERLQEIGSNPEVYRCLSQGALDTIREQHNALAHGRWLDALYSSMAGESAGNTR